MRRPPIACLLAAALLAGCGGAGKHASGAASPRGGGQASANENVLLERDVRAAVRDNARLSNYVLWHNAVPSWAAQSTGGPALAALRASAAARRQQRLQMLGIAPRFDILAIRVDPSYLSASATVRERGAVRPYRDGKSLGRPIKVNATARLELERIGHAPRFVVWKVGPAR
jgi:hypothetical protein